MLKFMCICVISILAGISQGVCGFGAGILAMMVLPLFYSISVSAGIAGVGSLVLTFLMVLRYRNDFKLKKVITPLIIYAIASALAIRYSSAVDQALLKRIFGGFLIVLTLYHFFLSKKKVEKWSIPVAVLAWAFSGMCSGLFSVGGPLMVLYYISNTNSKEEFLGTTECLFFLNLIMSTFLRIQNGTLTASLIPVMLIFIGGICVGLLIANKIVDRIDAVKLKNVVYIGVGVSGVLNVLAL